MAGLERAAGEAAGEAARLEGALAASQAALQAEAARQRMASLEGKVRRGVTLTLTLAPRLARQGRTRPAARRCCHGPGPSLARGAGWWVAVHHATPLTAPCLS